MTKTLAHADFSVAFYSGNRKTGTLKVVQCQGGRLSVKSLEVGPESGQEKMLQPVLLGVSEDHRAVLLDPKSKQIRLEAAFPADTFPAHIYSDPHSKRDWFMNDGEKESGNDTLNCGDKGSSVTVIENSNSANATFLKTLCVGRGHHQAEFTYPSVQAPQVPRRAYISSLNDGTVSVIGNDPADAATYLQLVATINLFEAEKEEGGQDTVPNKAFPHGLAYSPITGKLYNLNNGYGTVAVIDPVSNIIEERIAFKGHSNLFAAPGGRYLIGRGADRKSDPEHVIGKFSVLDVVTQTVVDTMDLPDIYLSKYFFNADGSKLYFTSGSSGSEAQQKNIKADVLLVLDLSALPTLKLSAEVKVGTIGTVDFHNINGRSQLVFCSDSVGGNLVILDGERDVMLETLPVAEGVSHSRVWTLPST